MSQFLKVGLPVLVLLALAVFFVMRWKNTGTGGDNTESGGSYFYANQASVIERPNI